MRVPQDLSKETQKKIAEAHVQHYTKMVEQGRKGVRGIRLDECETYLSIWVAGSAALEAGHDVPEDCGQEMSDAVYCGDYDNLLTEEERKRFNAEELEGLEE